MSNRISHSGIIESVADNLVKVRIVQTSACASCKVASHCNASESKVKIVDVLTPGSAYQVGQQVVVTASQQVARLSLLLGFGLPLLILVGVLVAVLRLTGNEGLAALSALGALLPYYLLLWLFRRSVSQRVSFRIEDIRE